METDEEKKRRELRKEAERDTQIAKERQEAQKRHQEDAHRAVLESELREQERKLVKTTTVINALLLEESHLERIIRNGYGTSSRSGSELVSKVEKEITVLRTRLDELRDTARDVENSLRLHEQSLTTARERERAEEDVEERGRDAAKRKQEHDSESRKLTQVSDAIQRRIQDIKRELSK